MKNLKLLFAGLVMVLSFTACSNDQSDEVVPSSSENEEAFHVRKTEGGIEGNTPGKR